MISFTPQTAMIFFGNYFLRGRISISNKSS